MHCKSCAAGVEMYVSHMGGVVRARVSCETKVGVVEFDPAHITQDQVAEAIEGLGYKVFSLKMSL